jgi:alpha-N-arabinofuranosidase
MLTIRILETESIGVVSPRLYGQFAEHLGRCCYDGLFVGTDCKTIPNVEGFRTDVLEALRALPVPLLRWPGGCYADHYHWRDGIGPLGERPVRLGLSCGLRVKDTNTLGTHEFLRFCELIGAEPYLAGNMGSGSVQEMCDWVEYCNSAVETELALERTSNGRTAPYGVRLWGVGNENWGCGGCYDPESYGLEYRRYASMLKHVEGDTELVACGHDQTWNERLIHTLRNHTDLVDHYSIHRYWVDSGPGATFQEDDYYRSIKEAEATEDFIKDTRKLLDGIDPNRRIGIALDEWGIWHPEARPWGPGGEGDCSGEYYQAATLRDAVLAAVALEGFHRQCKSLSLANLAQIVNVLHTLVYTEGRHMWLTPTYHLFKLHAPHLGANAVATAVEGTDGLPDGTPAVSATATVGKNGPALTLVNRHFSSAAEVRIPEGLRAGTVLAAEDPRASNSAAEPDLVALRPLAIRGGSVELPPHSVATFVQG